MHCSKLLDKITHIYADIVKHRWSAHCGALLPPSGQIFEILKVSERRNMYMIAGWKHCSTMCTPCM